jgi:hypothetical protein
MSDPHYVEGDERRPQSWLDIRTVLMEHWDPIGVCGEPMATDEYDRYIPKMKTLLRASANVEGLLDYLDWVATDRMGYTPQRERARPAANLLHKLTDRLEPLT